MECLTYIELANSHSMRLGRLIVLFAICVSLIPGDLLACTTAVISGRATADGRPLLWKNRDAPYRDNQVVYIAKGKYKCVAVVNAGKRDAVWMGTNEVGLCIENSLCRDLTEADAKGLGNGGLMLKALQTCRTVADVEQLLEQTNGKRSTNATYGVIDGNGGAMLFEVSPTRFARWDANDPVDAPNGYVVRSNFAFMDQDLRTVTKEQAQKIYSGDRYLRADDLLKAALVDGKITTKYLLQHCARDLADSAGQPLCGSVNGTIGSLPEMINTASTISRRTSVSAAVFHGVLPGENPSMTTMWVMLGEPGFSVAVPCWAAAGKTAEPLVGDEKSSLCSAVRELRSKHYSQPGKDGNEMLHGQQMQFIWKQTMHVENELLEAVSKARQTWRDHPPSSEELGRLHTNCVDKASLCIEQLLATSQSLQ